MSIYSAAIICNLKNRILNIKNATITKRSLIINPKASVNKSYSKIKSQKPKVSKRTYSLELRDSHKIRYPRFSPEKVLVDKTKRSSLEKYLFVIS